jgi:hypothetical protein
VTIALFTGLRAAETLAAFHRERAGNFTGEIRERHLDMAQRCRDDAEGIQRLLYAGGVSPEHEADVLRQRDVAAAQAIIGRHVLPEWRASEQTPRVLEAMAQDIATAMQAARGASS